MSKIGKINIPIPEKVKVILIDNNIKIEGPLGKKILGIDLDMFDLNISDEKEVSIKPKKINQNSKRLWGMNRSLVNNAVIGARSVVKAGITIGKNSVVAMGSIVTKDVPSDSVVVGSPAKIIYTRAEYNAKMKDWEGSSKY